MTCNQTDILLVGGGVMSATLGLLLMQMDSSLHITMVERLDDVSLESSNGWNNAGTGHAGYCELNYTPAASSGRMDISRAVAINAQFEVSLQWWSTLVEQGVIADPRSFINRVPHMSFVWGEDDVAYLRHRYEAMQAHHLFRDMDFCSDCAVLNAWFPLVMEHRSQVVPCAATRVHYGTDVDFGALTRQLVDALCKHPNFTLIKAHAVKRLRQHGPAWRVTLKDRHSDSIQNLQTGFVFLGAGGGALPLLLKSKIPESKGYGGFPVSGQWLVCHDQALAGRHFGKVYGKPPVGAPPMSVPHLDTRIINGQPALLFGPFAGFTTRFLKQGSRLDLIKSVRPRNIGPMMSVGVNQFDLTRYLVKEARQTHEQRVATLRGFYPSANHGDWSLARAGQRVQIIKRDPAGGGKLEFGTEVVASRDGRLAALLGASPGASVAAHAMISLIERCFPERMAEGWNERLKTLLPCRAETLMHDPLRAAETRQKVLNRLQII